MGQQQSRRSNDPDDLAHIKDICTAWAQKKYGSKSTVVSVNEQGLKVIEESIHYSESDKTERLSSVTRSRKTFQNQTSTSVEREVKTQSAKKYSCGWTRTKGAQVSGDLSVKVGLPAAVGLSARIGGKIQLSQTKTETSGIDEAFEQVTKFTQPPWSTWLTETVTTQKVVTMPYTQVLRLEGTLEITLQKPKGKRKTVSVDVTDLYPEGRIAGKRSVRITNEGIFEATTEMDEEIKVEEPDKLKTISNLSEFGMVDHYFVTKKVSEVKDTLERSRRVIVHGLCGAGKTQLLFKVAQDSERDYASVHPGGVVWVIDGTSEERIKDGVEKLRQSLTRGEARTGTTTLQSLLDRRSHVLLLIDDLPAAKHIPKELLNCSAKMLVTTQNSTLTLPESENILMEGFIEDEAVAFLTEGMSELSLGSTPREDIQELAQSFSCLPLGLAAARGTIQECNMTVKEYKEQLQGEKDAVKSLMDLEEGWLQDYYKEGYEDAGRNIFAALQMAVNKLDDQSKAMLLLCAFMMPQSIPVLILKEALEGEHPASDLRFVRDLKRYSLGNIDGEGVKRCLSIHGVTQMALRLHMDQQQQTTCINKVLQILVKFFVKDMTYSKVHKFSLALMPHVEAVLKHADNLELGPEHPAQMMKAMLLMVYGHLLMQKGTPDLSKERLEEAKKLLLQFAGIPLDIFSAPQHVEKLLLQFAGIPLDILSAQRVENFEDYDSKDLYQSLAEKSQSLEDGFFQETVVKRVITKQNLRGLCDKLSPEDRIRTTLEKMAENFEPLTMEMYNTLVDKDLAIPLVKLKEMFLPELYISIMYILGKPLVNKENWCPPGPGTMYLLSAGNVCRDVFFKTGVKVVGQFVQDHDMQHRLKEALSLNLLKIHCDATEQERERIFAFSIMSEVLKHIYVEELKLHKPLVQDDASQPFYDFGLLTSLGDYAFLKLDEYEKGVKRCIEFENSLPTQLGYISAEHGTCNKMLELIESEIKAGNQPLRLADYYITAGECYAVVNKELDHMEKAAEMFRKAYRVELEREEYHPRMRVALRCLILVHLIQKELRKARVCARRFLQLAEDHWPEEVPKAEEELRKVCCKIAFQARKENKEKEKTVCEKVTTV